MEDVARQLQRDPTNGIDAAELQQALVVMSPIKGNMLALERTERSLPEDGSAP